MFIEIIVVSRMPKSTSRMLKFLSTAKHPLSVIPEFTLWDDLSKSGDTLDPKFLAEVADECVALQARDCESPPLWKRG
jgi:hypothetical protein